MFATDHLEKGFLNVLRGIQFEAPVNLYVGLYLTNPTETGGSGTEISYPNYKRQLIQFSSASEKEGEMRITNLSQVNFPQSMVEAGTVSYLGVSDSISGGTMYAYGKLGEDIDVSVGEAPILMEGEVEYVSSGDLSKAYKKKFLDIFSGKSIPGVVPYMALFEANPEEGGKELMGENYKRVPIDFKVPYGSTTGQTLISNTREILFPRPSTDWGNWGYNVIVDDENLGLPMWLYDRGTTKLLKKGNMPRVLEEQLILAVN